MIRMIGEYYINPQSVAYMEIWKTPDQILGTVINFNAYAAAATIDNYGFEPLRLYIKGITPTQCADFLNGEPPF